MAERIQIIVSESGSRTVRRNIRGIGASAKSSSTDVLSLRNALFGLGAGLLVRQFALISDSFTQIQNRLGLVTDGQRQLAVVTREVFVAANESRSSFEATAEVYARTALSARNLGVSQREVINFTKALNQAIILSGATAQEARNGIIQFSQGLASNKLAGDELRATLEQLPLVADIIARQFGATRGELRKLAETGRITADEIFLAFGPEVQAQIQAAFDKTQITFGQAFAVLENSLVQFIGRMNQVLGLSSSLAGGIQLLAQHFTFFVNAVIFGLAIPAFFALVAAVNSLTVAVAANPIGLIAVGAGIAAASILGIAKAVVETTRGVEALDGAVAKSFLGAERDRQTRAQENFQQVLDDIRVRQERALLTSEEVRIVAELEKVEKNLLNQNVKLSESERELIANQLRVVESAKRAREVFDELNQSTDDLRQKVLAFNAAFREGLIPAEQLVETIGRITTIRQEVEELQDIIKDLGNSGGLDDLGRNSLDILNRAIASAESRGVTVTDEDRGRLSSLADEISLLEARNQVAEQINRPANELNNLLLAANRALEDGLITQRQFEDVFRNSGVQGFVTGLEEEVRLLKISNQEREVTVALEEALRISDRVQQTIPSLEKRVRTLIQERQALQEIQSVTDSLIPTTINFEGIQAELQRRLEVGAISAEQLNEALIRLKNLQSEETNRFDVLGGFADGLEKVQEKLTDFAGTAESTVVNAFQSMEDSLVQFVQTGEFNFSRLVDSILADLTRLLARQALVGLLGLVAPGGGGVFANLFSAGASAAARAEGGPVQAGRPFLVGEEGPELFVPNQGGQVFSNGDTAAMMGGRGGQPVNVTVVNVMDPNEIPAAMAGPEGTEVILNTISNNPDAIKGALS